MKKVLVATEKPFAAVAVDGIRQVVETAGYELKLLEKYTDKADLLAAVADADGLIIRSDKVDAEVLDAAKNLKIVVRAGAGYDNIDLAAATAHGVVAENTPGQNSNAVAELVFGMTIMAARNMMPVHRVLSLKASTSVYRLSVRSGAMWPVSPRVSVWTFRLLILSVPTMSWPRPV